MQRHIEDRLRDGQLDEANITIQELARIREAFIPVLVGIHHVRAPYPTEPEPDREDKSEAHRDG